jgi:hypothetical protein
MWRYGIPTLQELPLKDFGEERFVKCVKEK